VTELLDLSRIESGLIAHEKEQVDIRQLLADQKAFHSPYGEEKQISIHLNCPADLPSILANRQNMEEVMSNLITNGIKYSPVGATITISAATENMYLKLQVADTGFGIPEEDLEKIFSRFYRVKDANTRQVQGTGLGLAIVKSIIESHHGKISVASEIGRGTTFTILLPLANG
jgi:signal transduction histidine kinase